MSPTLHDATAQEFVTPPPKVEGQVRGSRT